MLDLFRRKAQSKFFQATILIIILVFVFWGVGTNQGNSRTAVATVNGEAIPVQDYQKQYDQMINRFRDQFGGTIPKGFLDVVNFKYQVVNELVQATLMRQAAQEMGLYVSDSELQQAIRDMEAFKKNGVFDQAWYDQVLTSSRLSVTKFEEGMRYDLLSAKIIDHLSRFGQVSNQELQALYHYNEDEIDLQFVELKAADFTEEVEVSDELLATFFEENAENYKSDPQVKVKYINLSLQDQSLDLEISERAIQEAYEANIDMYSTPAQRKASHILLKSGANDSPEKIAEARNSLEEIRSRVLNGEDFAELAKENSEDGSASRGGDLGYFSRGQMVPPFEEAVFALQEGEISEVVTTQFGFHLVKLYEIREAEVKTLADVRKQVIAKLKMDQGQTRLYDKANEIYRGIITAGSLDKYAATLEETDKPAEEQLIRQTDFFSQANPPQDLRTLPALVNAAFTLKKGELSSIIDTGAGRSYAILYVEEIQEPAPRELDEVRDKVVEDFKAQESVKLAKEKAEAMLSALKEGAEFTAECEAAGLTPDSTGFVSRAATGSSALPVQILQENFNLTERSPLPEEIAEQGSSYFVVAFKESRAKDPEGFEDKKDELTTQMAQEKATTLLSAWVEYLREKAEITVNDQLL